ncbi:heterokaryon incompatibility protein-domain-containing protein [Cladorrhinum samala]|uniref:Heterokaryon incompatibility protein-domain-containing protein n=1 Tax=Cladorrhinum samala TaxID=585594 RepID=A0AAV9HR76_9PEZI|nr:heterokaryon incompatibility protein-domain-containing protein [Cladorrhinum samala]
MDDPDSPPYLKCYHSLAPECCRVFELEPGNFSDPIVGRLVPQAIAGQPYEAVSYVWGDPRKRRDVTINGTTLSITANLYAALTAFRHEPQSGNSGSLNTSTGSAQRPVRRLWADALCINQADLAERTTQVELMGHIFASARRVLAWLGWEEGKEGRRQAQAAIRFIRFFMKDPEAGLRDARILLIHQDVTLTGPPDRLAFLSERDRRRFKEQARKWEAVKLFFKTEYFHRTWIVQELGLAREAIMYTALKPADRAGVGKGLGGEDGAAGSKPQALELDCINWSLVGRFARFLDFSAASLVTHLGLLSWVAHHVWMVWEMKEDGTPDCDFLTGMHWARILGVTDARDRVYALLGHPLARIDGYLVIKPDYTATRGVIYTRLAANFIRKTKNLCVVNLVDHEDDPCVEVREWDPHNDSIMPSWVPDWHSINRTTPLNYPIIAAKVADAEIRIIGDTEGAKGTSLPHLLVRGWVVDEISAVSPCMETTDFPVTNLTREQAKKNPFWLDRVWEMIFVADGLAGRDALAILETLSLALPLGTWEKGQPVNKVAGSQQTLTEHRRSFAAYVLEYHDLWRGVSEIGWVDAEIQSYLPARSLYNSLPAAAQTELRQRAEGATSEGFLESMTWSSMCRIVYRTASGLIGMGSRVTRPGDFVCRVQGSPVLMTMRFIKDSGASQGAKVKTESRDKSASISCLYIGPTVVPARLKRNVVIGRDFNERAARFRIV